MRGDKLLIGPQHERVADIIVTRIVPRASSRWVVSVAGESGAGKSELGEQLRRRLVESGKTALTIGQDDYFVFPPKTNHEMRRKNLDQVGLYEVKLDFLDSNLRSFKRAENPVLRPEVDYDADAIAQVESDLSGVDVVVVEGTYTSVLSFVDFRVFIDRTYRDTLKDRERRGRDPMEPFVEEVLEREHRIIRAHRELADCVVDKNFEGVRFASDGED